MFFRQKTSKGHTYLQIVENRREGGKVKQTVVATLGRLDELAASGQLDGLLRSGARFAESALVLSAHKRGELPQVGSVRVGPGRLYLDAKNVTDAEYPDVTGALAPGRAFYLGLSLGGDQRR